MILLDTNVISEAMRPSPNPDVIHWLDAQPARDVWISAITIAEIRLGIMRLPQGKRRDVLSDLAEKMFREDFANLCLPFDCDAARQYAHIVSQQNKQGRPVSVEDAQIAAIAIVGGLVLATRNTGDFYDIKGLALLNPWEDS